MTYRYPRELSICKRCALSSHKQRGVRVTPGCPRCDEYVRRAPGREARLWKKWFAMIPAQMEANDARAADFFERILPWVEKSRETDLFCNVMALELETAANRLNEMAALLRPKEQL